MLLCPFLLLFGNNKYVLRKVILLISVSNLCLKLHQTKENFKLDYIKAFICSLAAALLTVEKPVDFFLSDC